jgi:hypothetical protein
MTFKFTSKSDGQVLPLETEFTGTREEAYDRACRLAAALNHLILF